MFLFGITSLVFMSGLRLPFLVNYSGLLFNLSLMLLHGEFIRWKNITSVAISSVYSLIPQFVQRLSLSAASSFSDTDI